MEKRRQWHAWIWQVLGLSLCMSLCGCFDIREEVYLRKDDTGKYTLWLDFASQRPMIMALVQVPDSVRQSTFGQVRPLEHIARLFEEAAFRLEPLPGVAQVQAVADIEALNFKLQFDFASIESLNRALAVIGHHDSSVVVFSRPHRRKLMRHNVFHLSYISESLLPTPQDPSSLAEKKRAIVESINLKTVIRTEKKIKRCSHPNAVLEDGRRAILLERKLGEIRSGVFSLENVLSF